jgi:hypothetical protein
LAAFGEIALSSAGIEAIIETLIWKLLGVDQQAGTAVTEGQAHARPADRLIKLAKRTDLDLETPTGCGHLDGFRHPNCFAQSNVPPVAGCLPEAWAAG